jgi:hypothetical protein
VIFIQALEKMHAKANDKVKVLNRSSHHPSKPDTDSVFLSDAAHHAIEIDIKSDAYTQLNANMSMEASLLQAAIQSLNKTMLPIYSLDELKLSHNKWHLALQLPPNTTPRHKNHYGLGMKQSPTDIINYKFIMPVTSAAGKNFEFLLQLRAARFTQIANHWPQPNINPIRLENITSPYSAHFLESIEPSSSYFFDQDGNENQTTPILGAMQDTQMLSTPSKNSFLSGLRVWRSYDDILKIVLLGEPSLGAIYIANLQS